MLRKYHFTLLLISLFALAPLHGMENKPSEDEVAEFFDAIKKYFNDVACNATANKATQAFNLMRIEGLLKKNPLLINAIDSQPYNSEDKMTPLKTAMLVPALNPDETGDRGPELIQLLLQNGAHPAIECLGVTSFLNSKNTNVRNQTAHLLLSYGAQDSDNYINLALNYLKTECPSDRKPNELVSIIEAHINTRLAIAIENDDAQEVKRLVQQYEIDINKQLPYYFLMTTTDNNYGTPNVTLDLKWEKYDSWNHIIPLHKAKYETTCLLVNELGANVNIQNSQQETVLHKAPNIKVAKFLLSKGADLNIVDSSEQKAIDVIDQELTPEMLHELRKEPETIENLRQLKAAYEGKYYWNWKWKYFGAGVAVVAVAAVAKKIYDWYYPKAEKQEDNKSETEETDANEQQTVAS